MLSSPRWTRTDTLIALVLVALASRVLGDGAEAHGLASRAPDPVAQVVQVLASPLPAANEWLAMTSRYRLDGATRCIGLAEARRQTACASSDSAACRRATSRHRDMKMSLWPKGRAGQLATVLSDRIGIYARAYRALSDGDGYGARASSELILDRDNAMCRRYRVFIEARLHGSETRQSG